MMEFARARRNMIDTQMRPNGVNDLRVLGAFFNVPREHFVPTQWRPLSYIDEDLEVKPAADGAPARFLMEPMAFAKLLILAEIQSTDLVLDIGCATGYSTAVLAQLAHSVIGLESDSELAASAERTHLDLGVANATIVSGPLAEGYSSKAPYDLIVLEGAVEVVPDHLFEQLGDGGRLVAVVQQGPAGKGTLYKVIDGAVSSWVGFDASVSALPGFQRPPAFVF